MPAHLLTITDRTRVNDVTFVQPTDFAYREHATIDASVIVNAPNVSLYCVDPALRRALFVETAEEVDVHAAPFMYQAQYAAARRLIAVPYEILHRVADDLAFDASRLMLIYSVGRCGSTLVSRALREAPGVASLSEPDVYSQLQLLRETDRRNDDEIGALLRSCTRILCVAAAQRGARAWALKFRSFGIELSDLFQRHFPQAKGIFLYRAGAPWARSVGRAFGFFEPEALRYMPEMQQTFARVNPLIAAFGARHSRTITPAELLACMWTSAMQRARALREQGMPLFMARYDDTRSAPRALLDALFAYCGMEAADAAAIERVLTQDAQAGTSVSQETLRDVRDDHAQVDEVCRLIPRFDPTLEASIVLPGSFGAPAEAALEPA